MNGQESGPPGHAAHHAARERGGVNAGGWAARALASLTAVVGTVAGIAPHVLHHVLPLAGAAFLTGATGSAIFGAAGLLLSVPLLLRLRRRFQTWWAPAVALAVFVVAFSVSTFVIGPAISGDGAGDGPEASEGVDPHGH
ncbi:MAG: hypothetical protein KC461_00160 [Dehalococcoidia bacterium]|nr:hypothetical protein [Dehalococcoidia bacterium]MCA9849052.1 hypothetical protein [Dehalococcoidia bacterium]